MNRTEFLLGFRVLGDCRQTRRLVDWQAAFEAHAECDGRAELHRECYLSAFQFGEDFRASLESTGSTRGFSGPCWASWLWFDIDRESDTASALTDARRLAVSFTDSLGVDEDGLLAFYSGAKGFHVGIPSALWTPKPGPMFHRIARRFCESIAERAGVVVDPGVYDRVRCFRAPNSRHPKTGLHKRRLTGDELLGLSADAILALAAAPAPFEIPDGAGSNEQLAALWREATEAVGREAEAKSQRRAEGSSAAKLNRQTLGTIHEPPAVGDRHRLFYSAAANLREFGAPSALIYALLTESGLDSGLPPDELRRIIGNAIDAAGGGS